MKVKYINEFIFDYAQYILRDSDGKSVLLTVNYRENSYTLKNDTTENELLRKEAAEIAKDLLKRKCGMNMAEKGTV